jgi:uncharacterized protein YcbK (DUF882 family)
MNPCHDTKKHEAMKLFANASGRRELANVKSGYFKPARSEAREQKKGVAKQPLFLLSLIFLLP